MVRVHWLVVFSCSTAANGDLCAPTPRTGPSPTTRPPADRWATREADSGTGWIASRTTNRGCCTKSLGVTVRKRHCSTVPGVRDRSVRVFVIIIATSGCSVYRSSTT
uniref:Putative secreted protein n=1 Tax=Anopheles marajoara TaxID=58244 RepID=A0A2M4C8R8_9DIPT